MNHFKYFLSARRSKFPQKYNLLIIYFINYRATYQLKQFNKNRIVHCTVYTLRVFQLWNYFKFNANHFWRRIAYIYICTILSEVCILRRIFPFKWSQQEFHRTCPFDIRLTVVCYLFVFASICYPLSVQVFHLWLA